MLETLSIITIKHTISDSFKNTNEWIYAISGRVNNRSIWSEWDMNGSRRDIKVSGQFFK